MEVESQPTPQPPSQERTSTVEDRGFFASLKDTQFNSLITPSLIRFLYVVSIILLIIGVIVFIIAGFANSAGSGVVALILAPIVALIYLIVIRLYLELIVVAFKIREAVEETAVNTRPRA